MKEALLPAIDALGVTLAEQEKKVAETKRLINLLCEQAGMPPRYAEVDSGSKVSIGSIRPDTFYGKVLHSAVREYLDMRKGANLGPAETREIYDALVQGGFQFEAADANNAMTGIRAMMRKNSGTFHRLPNGAWGMASWYERIKTKKSKDDLEGAIVTGDGDEAESEKAADA